MNFVKKDEIVTKLKQTQHILEKIKNVKIEDNRRKTTIIKDISRKKDITALARIYIKRYNR